MNGQHSRPLMIAIHETLTISLFRCTSCALIWYEALVQIFDKTNSWLNGWKSTVGAHWLKAQVTQNEHPRPWLYSRSWQSTVHPNYWKSAQNECPHHIGGALYRFPIQLQNYVKWLTSWIFCFSPNHADIHSWLSSYMSRFLLHVFYPLWLTSLIGPVLCWVPSKKGNKKELANNKRTHKFLYVIQAVEDMKPTWRK